MACLPLALPLPLADPGLLHPLSAASPRHHSPGSWMTSTPSSASGSHPSLQASLPGPHTPGQAPLCSPALQTIPISMGVTALITWATSSRSPPRRQPQSRWRGKHLSVKKGMNDMNSGVLGRPWKAGVGGRPRARTARLLG